ncbi:hypothetical protein CEXT_645971 [Caerostris extrusa]|uniref:Uncharacterized protein n=1 Tax=Caerostris extrusa TaxID=172846 RepID=A0AAV4MEI1_CAEEX|nr:hypothetical protein CEXT_645971 [Caerostris extrusa]
MGGGGGRIKKSTTSSLSRMVGGAAFLRKQVLTFSRDSTRSRSSLLLSSIRPQLMERNRSFLEKHGIGPTHPLFKTSSVFYKMRMITHAA